jgi:hypothetical protein
MTVATRNVDDFVLTGVEILNPWEWEPGHVTLHREIEDILRDKGNKWMTPADIAAAINRRGRYRKRKGTEMQSTQVAGRARQYDKLFECRSEGSHLQIRLRRGL